MPDDGEIAVGLKIALAGRKFCGKDACAKVLEEHFGFSTFSFSDQLKKIAHRHFKWLQEDYPQELKEKKIWVSPYDGKEWSPRDVWVALNVLVEIDPDILVDGVHIQRMRSMMKLEDDSLMKHCIKDLRPHNPRELKYCVDHGFVIIYINNVRDPVSEDNLHETEKGFDAIVNRATAMFQNNKLGEQPFIDFITEMGIEKC